MFKITPEFNVQEIINRTIKKDWFLFQEKAFFMGQKLTTYMQNYIARNHKRRGGSGRLEKSIKFYGQTGAGWISWGIGLISELPKYYYVINYGKMITGQDFVPFHGKRIPGSFEGGRAEAGLKGGVEAFRKNDGSGFSMKPGRPVRAMHYIEATKLRLNANFRNLLLKIKMGK